MVSEHDRDIPAAVGISLAAALGPRASLVECARASHVGPLLGRDAARFAVTAATFSHPLDGKE
jgi:hypothetical protein